MSIGLTLLHFYNWSYWGIVLAGGLFLIGLLLKHQHLQICLIFIGKPYKRYMDLFLRNLKLPLQGLFILAAIMIFLYHGNLVKLHSIFLLHVFHTLLVLLIDWGIWRQTTHTKDWILLYNLEFNHSFHRIAVPLIRRGARLVLVLSMIVILSYIWGLGAQKMITGMGVLGLIITLSTQDLIKNTINAFFLLFNNVFDIGDWIQTGQISGSVEAISLRFTKIKTQDHGMVTIPNTQIANSNLINWTRRSMLFCQLDFSLDPNQSPTLYKCIKHIENRLFLEENIFPESVLSLLNTKNGESLIISFLFDVRTINYKESNRIKLQYYCMIKEIFDEYGIHTFYPTFKLNFPSQ